MRCRLRLCALVAIGAAAASPSLLARDIPVRRAEEHDRAMAQRDVRVARHLEHIAAYTRNVLNPDAVAAHQAILDSAVEMETAQLTGVAGTKRASTDGGSAPLVDYYAQGTDIGYAANLSIGTPGQVFSLIPDTGSADLWVPGSAANDPGHATFTSSSSSTYQSTSQIFDDAYGLGEASGVVARDTIQFAGFSVANKTFGVATKVDSQFQQQENDGIVGLASSIIANMSSVTYFEALIQDKLITNPYFSVFLARGSQYTTAAQALVSGSNICLGCMASPVNAQTSGSMFYTAVSLFAFWEIPVSSISLNGQTLGSTSHSAIVDTGTTALYLPTTVAAAMMAPVNGIAQRDGSYLVPASALSTSTRFTFNFAGGSIDLNVLDLIAGYSDSTRRYFVMNVYGADTQDPKGNLIAILGDVVIKNALTVFSYSTNGAPAVGLQQLVASTGSGSGTTASVAVVTQTQTDQPGATTGTLRRTRTSAGFTYTSGPAVAASSRSAARAGPGAGAGWGGQSVAWAWMWIWMAGLGVSGMLAGMGAIVF